MPYRITIDDPGAAPALRRIAVEQIDRALAEVDDPALPLATKVHQIRKRAKKLRGLVRLVRPAFAGYAEENRIFRDAARRVSDLRDHAALIETYDRVMEAHSSQIDRRAFGPLRRRLTLDLRAAEANPNLPETLGQLRDTFGAARARAANWELDKAGFDALSGGLKTTYERARKGLDANSKKTTPGRMHNWRKRVKYHRYHARLMSGIWPLKMKAHATAAVNLGELLGRHHDLHVFSALMPDAPVVDEVKRLLDGLIAEQSDHLEAQTLPLGIRLFADPPKVLVRRWGVWWARRETT